MDSIMFKTASGSQYVLSHGDTLTRLSEVPMYDGRGEPLFDLVWAETATEVSIPCVGEPFTCWVLGKPLRTTPVVSVEYA